LKIKKPLGTRREPQQKRAQKRIDEILDTTARLLTKVGLDDLTTVMIARELGISVGSVYHYFPNKFAILYAVGEQWLAEMSVVLDAIDSWDIEEMGTTNFVDCYCDEMLKIYRQQVAVLPLVQAMFSVPELRQLDERHDDEIISCLMRVLGKISPGTKKDERNRIGRLILEVSHALFLVVVEQNRTRGAKTLADLKKMLTDHLLLLNIKDN
jgi:AcrR family transcriptional regulator